MSAPRIAVTGLGMVSAIGWTAEESWGALLAGREGLGPLTLFSSPRCGHFPIGEVKGDPGARSGVRGLSRSDNLAVIAAREAAAQAGLDRLDVNAHADIAVVLGASTGGILDSEEYLAKLMRDGIMDLSLTRRHECACSTDAVGDDLGALGFRATVCSACASGGTALSTACDVIRSGEASIVVAGGVDSLTRLTLNGFASLLVVADDGCRPFDSERHGMSLGEGAGMLVLESEEHARARGAKPLAFLDGIGITCDALHASAPAPDGVGIALAMRMALCAANIAPADVAYLNAHGTGTRENDPAEATAICEVFASHLPAISSTKRFFGHTLAAAGAIEAIVSIMAMRDGIIPPNAGLREVDGAVGFEPVREARRAQMRAVMSNSLGFGGTNCAVVFTAP